MAIESFSAHTLPSMPISKRNARDTLPSSIRNDAVPDDVHPLSKGEDGETESSNSTTKENGGDNPYATLQPSKPGSRLKRGSVLKTFQIKSKDKDPSQSSSSSSTDSYHPISMDSQLHLSNSTVKANDEKLRRPGSGSILRKTFRNSIRNPFRTKSENALRISAGRTSTDESAARTDSPSPVAEVKTPQLEAFSFEASRDTNKADSNKHTVTKPKDSLSVATTIKPVSDWTSRLENARTNLDMDNSGLGHHRSPSSSYPTEGVRTPPEHPKSPPRTFRGYPFESIGQDMSKGLAINSSLTKVMVHDDEKKEKEEPELVSPAGSVLSVEHDGERAATSVPVTGTLPNSLAIEHEPDPALEAMIGRAEDLLTVITAMTTAKDAPKENARRFAAIFQERPEDLNLYFPRTMALDREVRIVGTSLRDKGMSGKYFHAMMKDFTGALGLGGLEAGNEQLSVLGGMIRYKRELHVVEHPEEIEAWRLLTARHAAEAEDEMMRRFTNTMNRSDLGSEEEFKELREMDPALAQLFLDKIAPEIHRVLDRWEEAGLYPQHELKLARGGPGPWRNMQHRIIVEHLPWLWLDTPKRSFVASKVLPSSDQHGTAESSSTLIKSAAVTASSESPKGSTQALPAPTMSEVQVQRDMPSENLHLLDGTGAPLERVTARRPFDTKSFTHDPLRYWRRLVADTSEGEASASSLRVLTSRRRTASHSSLPRLSLYPNRPMSIKPQTISGRSFSSRLRGRLNYIAKKFYFRVPASLNLDD